MLSEFIMILQWQSVRLKCPETVQMVYGNNTILSKSEFFEDFGDPPKKPVLEVGNYVTIFPNPSNPKTTISYLIKTPSHVKLVIYSITGQKVATLVDKHMSIGSHSVIFDGSDFGSGVYLYKFNSKGFNKTGKMLLLK